MADSERTYEAPAGPVEESLACTVKLNVPPAVGVPLNVPPADNVTPAGNAPALIVKLP